MAKAAALHGRREVGEVADGAHALRIDDRAEVDELAAPALVVGDPAEELGVVTLRESRCRCRRNPRRTGHDVVDNFDQSSTVADAPLQERQTW
jgi:hypothetical protein